MPTLNITNIPEIIYGELKNRAEQHHRNINSEVLIHLKKSLFPKDISLENRLNNVQNIRSTITPNIITIEDIDHVINEGRP